VTWLLFALAAGVASAVNVWASKLLVARLRPAVLGGVVHVTGGLLCLVGVALLGADLTPAAERLPHLLVMTIVYVAGNLLYFHALAHAQLSEIDLLLRTSAMWTVVLGAAALREPLGVPTLAGSVLVVASITLLARTPQRVSFSRPQVLALLAALLFGAGNVIDKAISAPFHPLAYTALNLVLTGVGMLVVARPTLREVAMPALWQAGAWVVAATFALTQWLIILAYDAGGTAGNVILSAQVRLLLLMTVGTVLLHERDRLGRKAAAALGMIAGIALLAAGPGG
jgi:drug/metabolite transporter (DMT)-like permease